MKQKTICVVGSGAGAGPIIYELSKAGHNVIVLEKGPWLLTSDFSKDEITYIRRDSITPKLKDEPYVIEKRNKNGEWVGKSNFDGGQNFWNGNIVGGSSNLMSGFFSRMKPQDFKLLSTYGTIKDSNLKDWPINYDDMEPYYDKVEKIIDKVGDFHFPTQKDEVEFNYRKARFYHKTNKIAMAIALYKVTVNAVSDEEWYFGPNSALQLGYIYKAQGDIESAAKYFNMAIEHKNHEYKYSIDNKAKSGLESLKTIDSNE